MKPTSRAMLWYFWRLSRVNILLMVTLCLSAALLLKTDLRYQRLEGAQAPFAYLDLLLQVILIVAFSGFLFIQQAERAFGPSTHLLTLPITTRRYVAVFYGYLITIIGTVSCAMTFLHLHYFGNVIQHAQRTVVLPFWQMPLLCISLACMVQSLFHLFAIKNLFRFLPLTVVMLVMAFTCVRPMLDLEIGNPYYKACTPCLIVCFAYAFSYGSIAACRRGLYGGGSILLTSILDRSTGRTRVFKTPEQALFWLAWRRHGRIFLFGTLLFCLVGITLGIIDELDYTEYSKVYVFQNLMLSICVAVILSAAFLCSSVSLFRDGHDLYWTGQGFFLTLPVRSVEFSRGRLLAMAFSLFLVLIVVTAALLPLKLATPPADMSLPEVVLALLLTMAAAWIAIWFGLWAGLAMMLLSVIASLSFLYSSDPLNDGVFLAVEAALIALATGTVLILANRRALLDRHQIILMVLSFLAVLVVGLSFQPKRVWKSQRFLLQCYSWSPFRLQRCR